jgi:hypothetical protein
MVVYSHAVTIMKYEAEIRRLIIDEGQTLYREGLENLLGINKIEDKDRRNVEKRILQKALRKLRKQKEIIAIPDLCEDKPGQLTLKFKYRKLSKEEAEDNAHSETYLAKRHLYRELQSQFESLLES